MSTKDQAAATAVLSRLRRLFRRTRVVDYSTKRQPLAWPSAVLLCVRHPDDHHALLAPYEDYPVGYPNIFGPPRTEPRCVDCGGLMYVAGARVTA